jgi:hypothetical protein
MTYIEKTIDTTTGEETIRLYTEAEIAIVEAEKTKVTADKAILDTKMQAKNAARQTVLDKLGLTAEEVTALLN